MASSSVLTASSSIAHHFIMDHSSELDAAEALLGVSPATTTSRSMGHNFTVRAAELDDDSTPVVPGGTANGQEDTHQQQESLDTAPIRRPRSGSVGLDALADIATQETESSRANGSGVSSSSSDSDDSEAMPPPPPRRRRAASNPEGMEKWDSLSAPPERRHWVLPASILEEELAMASAAVQKQKSLRPTRQQSIPEHEEYVDEDDDDEDPVSDEDDNNDEEKEEVDEANLSPEELLRRARARLLEDLLEGKMSGEDKGVLILPHALDKYKKIYNKNGRIGIYTPAERAAIIAKFNRKRSRRVWNKKIRYGCRKSLADRRLRVKGRFVKRSEQEQLAKALAKKQAEEQQADADMPDVNDPDAGFAPTEDQPYRRLRRHTIT